MAWKYLSSTELALTLLTVKPLTLEELRLYYRILVVRGLQVVGGWSDIEEAVRSMVARGLAQVTPDGRIYIEKGALPEGAQGLLEENIRLIASLLSPPGGA